MSNKRSLEGDDLHWLFQPIFLDDAGVSMTVPNCDENAVEEMKAILAEGKNSLFLFK